MKLLKLTSRQDAIYSFLLKHQETTGSLPTIREITEHFGFKSINNARQHLRLIEQKGYINLVPNKSRGIRVVKKRQENILEFKIPIIGSIAAGTPITAIENIENYLTLDQDIFKGDNLFALRVKGDSMVEAGIMNNDIAVIRQQSNASNGEVVAVIIDGDATLKRYIKHEKFVVLHPENKKYGDIIVTSDMNFQIVGKLAGVIRKY
ncbi:MAG: transcriptional repressor LexA [Chitinivibrionales bacterium]|nr:transcriptional repressor LexA [Chitinivibrionales bacterium]